jgi:hypothetical protein
MMSRKDSIDDDLDAKKRVDQFYKLLADYGLTGRSQPLDRRKGNDVDAQSPHEEE